MSLQYSPYNLYVARESGEISPGEPITVNSRLTIAPEPVCNGTAEERMIFATQSSLS